MDHLIWTFLSLDMNVLRVWETRRVKEMGWWRKRQTDKDRTTDFSVSLLLLDMLSL